MNSFGLMITILVHAYLIQAQDNENFDLKYSIDNEEFQKLTTFNLRSLKQSQYQENSNAASLIYSEKLSDSLRTSLNRARLHDDSLLRLAVCKSTSCVSSFIFIKNLPSTLTTNDLKLSVTLHQALMQPFVQAINIHIDPSYGNDNLFTIKASLVTLKPAEVPDTNAFIVRRESETKQQQNAETNNKSFLAKYWYYIVPVALLLVVSNMQNPEGGAAAAAQ